MDYSPEQIDKDISDLSKEYVRVWKQTLDIDVRAIKIKYNQSNKYLIYSIHFINENEAFSNRDFL